EARRDRARRGVVHRPGDRSRRHAGLPFAVDALVRDVERLASAEACADQRADALGLEIFVLRLLRRFVGGDQREAAEPIEAFLQAFVRFGRHLARDLAGEGARIDRGDAADSAAALAQGVERRRLAAAERRDQADAGDGDTDHEWLRGVRTSRPHGRAEARLATRRADETSAPLMTMA